MSVVILGGSPNELACAIALAKSGEQVTLLERSDVLGGTSAPVEFAPGFRAPLVPPSQQWVAPRLGVDAAGGWSDAAVTSFGEGEPLTLFSDLAKSRAALEKHSPKDASKLAPFAERMARLAGFLESLYLEEPPRLMSDEAGDLFSLMAVGLRLRRLGKVDMIELLRTLPMSVSDLLDDWFESDRLKATIGAAGVTSLLQGPRSAGTCFVMLHHLVGRPVGAFRARRTSGEGLVDALVAKAKAAGVTMRTGVDARVVVDDGRATGVVVDGKETIAARVVVSGLDPKTTFLRAVDPTELEPETMRAVRNVKLRGVRAVMALALGELPKVDEAILRGTLAFAPSLDFIERAYDDAKHGGISKRPVVEATIPSLDDPSLAPKGKHVMHVAVQYVPYRATWDDDAKRTLETAVTATLAEHLPGLKIEARALLGPRDIEERCGLAEGHFYAGELGLDQILFMRPIPGFAHYRSPIEGLFMCGDACHPGGALPGLAGLHASKEIGKDA